MVHIFTYDFEWSVSFLHLWVHVYFVILTTYLRGAAAMCPVVASNGVGWEWTSRLPLVTESNNCAQRITIVTPTENQTVPYHNHTLAIVNIFSNKLLLFSPQTICNFPSHPSNTPPTPLPSLKMFPLHWSVSLANNVRREDPAYIPAQQIPSGQIMFCMHSALNWFAAVKVGSS